MKTVLAWPPSWSLAEWSDEGFTLVVDPEGLTLEVLAPRYRTRDTSILARERLERGLPPGALQIARTTRLTTACGWPLDLVDAAVIERGEVIEGRMAAVYQFLDHAAVALVRSRRQTLLGKHRAQVVEALRSARPAWSGARVLADLWS